jgi:hypothetical protein
MSTTTLWKRTLPRRSRTRSAARRIRSVTVVKKDTFRKPKQSFLTWTRDLRLGCQSGASHARQRAAGCQRLSRASQRKPSVANAPFSLQYSVNCAGQASGVRGLPVPARPAHLAHAQNRHRLVCHA